MSEFTDFETLVVEGAAYRTRFTRKFAQRTPYVAPDATKLLAHLPGVIVTVHVRAGDRVKRGDPLLVLEAMKMKNDLLASRDATVKTVHVTVGQMAAKGQLLIEYA